MTKLLPFASLVLVAVSSTAAAQHYVAADPGDISYAREPRYKQTDARIGVLLGGSDVGDADGYSTGISGSLGYRTGDITLRGVLDYYRVGDGTDEAMNRKGRSLRLGGAVRYAFAHTAYDAKLAADFWGEAGLAYEHVMWRQGGILDRPSAEIAFGYDIGARAKPDQRGNRRTMGYFMAFRTLMARGPEMDGAVATCGGPCSVATKPSRTDVSMFFELGVHWGR